MSTPPPTAITISSPPPSPSPSDLYNALTKALIALQPQTIEILPSSLPLPTDSSPFLYQDSALGIPKRHLISAFTVARQKFFSQHQYTSPVSPNHDYEHGHATNLPPILLPTYILLLFDPEHFSAANARKRYLLHALNYSSISRPITAVSDSNSPSSTAQLKELVDNELTFLSTLQTSPLPRHAKSSTLWWHRIWLITTFNEILFRWQEPEPMSSFSSSSHIHILQTAEAFLLQEMNIVLQAASRHKSNYHAFFYARRLLTFLLSLHPPYLPPPTSTPLSPSLSIPTQNTLLTRLHTFCLSHPRDISGWSFLAFLLNQDQDHAILRTRTRIAKARAKGRDRWGGDRENGSPITDTETDTDTMEENKVGRERRRIREEVISRTESFVQDLRWKGESVEWFLRTMTRGTGVVGRDVGDFDGGSNSGNYRMGEVKGREQTSETETTIEPGPKTEMEAIPGRRREIQTEDG